MDDLELIKQKINIVDLIQEYTPLKKTGANFKANCPFHQEKTASFVVSPERGIWHCFGCQKGGDIFKFLMEKEGLTFVESLEQLAKKAGVTLKKTKAPVNDKRERLFELNLKAREYFHYLLLKHELGKKALEYLKSRGLTDQTIEEFQLGYAPNSWDSLTNFAHKRGFSTEELIDSGLAVASTRGCYDRFRGRVIFPLVDVKSQVIGFAGRVLDKSEPKYINTPQTAIFDKSNYLFGLNLAKGEIRNKKQAILTEGEMDMIMSYQGGVKNVVASKGTALTFGQIELVKKYTETIVLCFDMDLAGDSASRRGIEMADSAGLSMKVIKIADGKDPAELASKNVEKWIEAVDQAEPIYDYYLRSVSARYNLNQAESKRKIAAELIPVWSKITDPVIFEHYLQKLSALISIPEDVLRREIRSYEKNEPKKYQEALKPTATVSEIPTRSRRDLLEEYLIALLIKIPYDLVFVPNFPETIFVSKDLRTLYVFLVIYLDQISFKGKLFSFSDFVKTLPAELVPMVDKLFLNEIDERLSNSKAWQNEISVVVSELKKVLIKASLEKLSTDIKSAQVFGKMELLETLNKRFRDLSLKLKNL